MSGHLGQIIDDMWAALERQDFDAAGRFFHDDVVQEWPQSGERIRGLENVMEINKNYPGFPKMTPRRTVIGGNLVVQEVVLDYDGQVYNGISVFDFEDDKIKRETDYFAAPFEAPEWRSRWVERM
jgi:hypothetical protein